MCKKNYLDRFLVPFLRKYEQKLYKQKLCASLIKVMHETYNIVAD